VRVEELRDPARIREIDRSESVSTLYVHEDGELRAIDADLELPGWDEAELARLTARLAGLLEAGRVVLGAFEGDELVGAAALAGAELAFLYVSRSHRGRGVAKRLLDDVALRAGRGAPRGSSSRRATRSRRSASTSAAGSGR
jgi:GNAT superfamily N-acetyltransferase